MNRNVQKIIAMLLVAVIGFNAGFMNVLAESIDVMESEDIISITDETSEEDNSNAEAQLEFESETEDDEEVQSIVAADLSVTGEACVLLNGTTECSSISEALELIDVSSDNELKLLKDITENNSIVISDNTNITIDMNEFNLDVSAASGSDSAGIINNGNLIIKGNGEITATPNWTSDSGTFSVIKNNNGRLEVDNCTLVTETSISATGSFQIAILDVYGINNSGDCIVRDSTISLNARSTSSSTQARTNCYGIYNKGGKITVESCMTRIIAYATAQSASYRGDAIAAGIYCDKGEVNYISGEMSLVSFSTASGSSKLGFTWAVYNKGGTVNIGTDDEVFNDQPDFTQYGIATVTNAVTNIYDGKYNSDSLSGPVNSFIDCSIEFYDDNVLLYTVKCNFGEAIKDAITPPVKSGYEFKNWQTEEGKYFSINSAKYAPYKVYAVWEPIRINKIEFELPEKYVDEYADVMPYLSINENESVDLSEYITYSPEEYVMNNELLWGTSDESKVKITDNGIVQGLVAGVVTVSAVLREDLDIQASAAIEVKHVWDDEYTIDKQPTCEEAGSESIHCTVCDSIKEGSNRVVPALEHNIVVDEMVPPTCTIDGKTEGSHCSNCGHVFKEQEAIPANGHMEVIDEAIPPTYIELGKTEGSHCSVCNIVIRAQEEIPVLEHKILFVAGYGIETSEQSVKEGDKLQEPAAPVIEGYTYNGWYTSINKQDETTKWDFANDVVKKDMVLYAGWDFVSDWSGHPIDADDIEVSFKKTAYSSMVYTGTYLRPEITVKYINGNKKILLKENSDYILKYENNLQVGNGKILIYGTGEFSASRELGFTIKEKSISKAKVSPIPNLMVSSNLVDEVGNAMNVVDGTRLLVYGEDFDISLSQTEVTSPTKVSVIITGKGNYTDKKSKGITFLLSPYDEEHKNINEYCNASFSSNKLLVFSGKALKPKVIVTEGNKKLSSSNYKIVYKDNIEVGTGYAIVYGCNEYCGSITLPFTIEPKEIGKCKLQVKNTTLYYNDREQKNLDVIVKDGQRALKEGIDYSITYVGDFKNLTGKVKPYIEIHALEGGNYKEGSRVLSKKFKIVKGRLNSKASIDVVLEGEGVSYDSTSNAYKVPAGTVPQVIVTYNGEPLSGNIYTKNMNTSGLSYTYKLPIIKAGKKSNIKISGVNNFSKSITIKCIGY